MNMCKDKSLLNSRAKIKGEEMGNEILSRCGYRCDLCLAYKPNIDKEDRREILQKGWLEIYGIYMEIKDIVCEGCVSCEFPKLIDFQCPVRSCVLTKKLDNCASCDRYSCKKLDSRMVDKKELEIKLRRVFSDEEYNLFIRPYESKKRLDKLIK